MGSYVAVYVGLAVLAPLFLLIERGRPRQGGALRVDLAYWAITPLFTGTLSRVLTLGVVAVFARAAGDGADGPGFLARMQARMPFAHLPFFVACPLALLVADFFGYASHRLRHTAALWRAHAVHHAAEDLAALSAARLHPIDETLDAVLLGVPVLLLGFPLPVYAALGPFFVLHTLLLHARVPWSFGPLGYVFASPRFHRRHHARDLPPRNYGGVFAFYDLIFGTFEMPAADPPSFGIAERDVPESVLGQMAYPFRRILLSLR